MGRKLDSQYGCFNPKRASTGFADPPLRYFSGVFASKPSPVAVADGSTLQFVEEAYFYYSVGPD